MGRRVTVFVGLARWVEDGTLWATSRAAPPSNRWSWTVILVEVANSHEFPVPQLPIIADSGEVGSNAASEAASDAALNSLADFCRAEMGA